MSIELVGVLNMTPDSIHGAGLYMDPDEAEKRATQLFASGASIVDIGGAATNPKAHKISSEEELDRIETLVRRLLPTRDAYSFSIDSYRPEIVEHLAKWGKFIINDVTTFINPKMIAIAAELGYPVIASHMPLGARGDFEFAHTLQMDAWTARQELLAQRLKMLQGGIREENVILDPGLGFGKTMRANWELVDIIAKVTEHEAGAWMLGPSEKRMLIHDEEGLLIPNTTKTDRERNRAAVRKIVKLHRKSPYYLQQRLLIRVHTPEWYTDIVAEAA